MFVSDGMKMRGANDTSAAKRSDPKTKAVSTFCGRYNCFESQVFLCLLGDSSVTVQKPVRTSCCIMGKGMCSHTPQTSPFSQVVN